MEPGCRYLGSETVMEVVPGLEVSQCLCCFALELSSKDRAVFSGGGCAEPIPALKALLPSTRQPKPETAGNRETWTDDVLHF